MIIGVLTVDLLIQESNSLKDKRQVIKGLLDSIRNKFNVSAAEIGELNIWRRSEVGFTCISNDKKIVNSSLNKVLAVIESEPRIQVESVRMEFV